MSQLDIHTSVVDWCIEHPETLPIFEKLGIDYCCGGKSLEYACWQQSLEPGEVLAQLHQQIKSRRPRQRDENDR